MLLDVLAVPRVLCLSSGRHASKHCSIVMRCCGSRCSSRSTTLLTSPSGVSSAAVLWCSQGAGLLPMIIATICSALLGLLQNGNLTARHKPRGKTVHYYSSVSVCLCVFCAFGLPQCGPVCSAILLDFLYGFPRNCTQQTLIVRSHSRKMPITALRDLLRPTAIALLSGAGAETLLGHGVVAEQFFWDVIYHSCMTV